MDRSRLTDEQQHAVRTMDANYPLIAGAGTGKTTTLAFRYVELLDANPDLSPREILVTTFTRRAASDLIAAVRDRILHRIGTADPADDTDIERWRRVLDELDEAYVHTLHAFCQRILQEHAIDAPGIQLGFDVIDDIDATQVQAELIEDAIAARPDAVETILASNITSEQGLANILDGLFSNRPHSRDWAQYWSAPERTVDEYVTHVERSFHPLPNSEAETILADDELAAAIESLREFAADPPMSDTGKSVERIHALLECCSEAGGLDGPSTPNERRRLIATISDILTTGSGDRYASYSPKQTGWTDTADGRERIGELVETVVERIDAVHWQDVLGDVDLEADRRSAPLVFALATLFDTVASRYQAAKRDRNLVDYTDLVQTTHDLLTQSAPETTTGTARSVRAVLQSQFEYVMIDEVQDTDPSQWDIVSELTRLGGDASPYSSENVFVVGDEKQSIYRFRGADVGVFDATRRDLVTANTTPIDDLVASDLAVTVRSGDRPGFELAENFRTLPTLLEVINGVFDGIFEDDSPDRAAFESPPQALTAGRDNPAGVDPTAEYLLVPDEELAGQLLTESHPIRSRPAYQRRANEARAVAARITTLVNDQTLVYPEDPGTDENTATGETDDSAGAPAPVTFDDIAIILRKRTHLHAFKHALEEETIPYTVVQGDGFFETPEVKTLLNLLKALADPGQEIPLYGVLRSPLFGVRDDTIAAYAEADDVWSALRDAEDPALDHAVTVLKRARSRGGCDESTPDVEAWSDLLEWVLDQTGYRASVSADERPRQAIANVDKFRDLVASHDDKPSLSAVVERLEAEREHADYSPEAAIPDGSSGVQLMTVHAAKGDEFPVVIVPGINDAYPTMSPINNNVEFEVLDDTPELGLPVPDPDNPFETTSTIAREGVKTARLKRLRAEEKRILYVACTRARDHLLLAGTHAGEVTDTGSLDLDDADPEEPRSWSDLLQPLLLDGDLSGLVDDETTVLERVLPEEYHRERATTEPRYTVRLPPRAAAIDEKPPSTPGTVQAELDKPTRPSPTYRLSPSQIADLEGDQPDGQLVYDAASNTIHYESESDTDSEIPASTSDESEVSNGDEAGGPVEERTLYGRVFGEAVHRICELQPPQSEWRAVIDDTLLEMDADHDVTAVDEAAVYEHAKRAIAFVDEEMTSQTRRYDELELTAELSGGELTGFIDCLLVNNGNYHIIDYKTGDHDPEDLEKKSAYYQPQLDAYAAMLAATAEVKTVTTTLYYTALNETHTKTYPGGIESDEMEHRITRLLSRFDVET